jgi:hypothetical protein
MNNPGLIDSFTYIPTGTMICEVVQIKPQKFEAALMIKDIQFHLNLIPEGQIDIEFRSGSIVLDEVVLVPLMIQICKNPILTYVIWLNYFESKDVFTYLANQDLIRILFVNDKTGPLMAFSIGNSLQLGLKIYLQQLKNRIPWSKEDYDCAKTKIIRLYPTSFSLWHGLKEIGEKTNGGYYND